MTRWYRRRFGHHTRFYIAVFVTIVAVAYVVVPPVAQFFDAASGYDPRAFEPKDAARQTWLETHARAVGLPAISTGVLVNVVLFLLVVIVWLALVPPGACGRR